MKRFLLIGGLGVVLILLALGLSFRMMPGDESGTGESETAAVDRAPREAPPPAAGAEPAEPAAPQSDRPAAEPPTSRPSAEPPAARPSPQPQPAQPGDERQITVAPAPSAPAERAAPAESTEGPATAGPGRVERAPQEAEPAAPDIPKIAVVPRDVPEAKSEEAIRPEFDIARVMPEGDTVLAGRAEPGAEVTILDGDRAVGSVTADSRGEWVLVAPEPLEPGSHELGLSARAGEEEPLPSDSVVVVVVPEPERDIAGREEPESRGSLALEVPREGFGASTVLQKPPAASEPELAVGAEYSLGVDVLDYDEAGNLSLTGASRAGSEVRVYLDNALVGRTAADADGRWRLVVDQTIDPGRYTVRVDEVAGDSVIARLEFPFERVTPQVVEEGTLVVVVQPGNSLWRIARRTLGEGTRYTIIFEANRERIRDPDLIYPGQIFTVPSSN